MAQKDPIKNFILHDRHGNEIDFSSLSVVGEVEVILGTNIGKPTANSSYQGGKLTISLDNIKGDGITNIEQTPSIEDGGINVVTITCESGAVYTLQLLNGTRGNGITAIETEESQEDGGTNTVTFKTSDNPEGKQFHIKNGHRGNGIASVTEEVSEEDGGINTVTITDDDGHEHTFHTRNGRTGPQGDSAVFNPESPDHPLYEMANVEGSSTTKSMTQRAATEAARQRGQFIETSEDNGYLYVMTDAADKIVFAIKKDGDVVFGAGVPTQIQEYITAAIAGTDLGDIANFIGNLKESGTLEELLDEKANVEDVGEYIDSNDYLYVLTDSANKILLTIGKDGTWNIPSINSPTIAAIEERLNGIEQKHVLNVANSDKIAIVGDSLTHSGYCVKGKSYIAKISLFSDYVWSNFGASGDTYLGRLNAIRQKEAINGTLPFDEQNIKYAMLCSFVNDVKYLANTNQYVESTRMICSLLQGIGVEPIICTEYFTGANNNWNTKRIRSVLRNVAKEYGVPFFDIASIVDLVYIYGAAYKYEPFWGSTHPGTRTNAIESDNYEKYLSVLPRPMQSLKLFRARTDDYDDLDEYMFHTIEQRAELFNEINVGAMDITNPADVDNLTKTGLGRTQSLSEYQLLAQNEDVTFGNISLISAVLATRKKDLKSLSLAIEHTGSIQVYVKNTLAEPYPSPTRYTSFRVTYENAPSQGDTYQAGTKTFTVYKTYDNNDGTYSMLCSPFVSGGMDSEGRLTKVSGNGDSEIHWNMVERGIDVADVFSDTLGHWVEVEAEEDGTYNLGAMPNCMDVDRVDILLVSSSDYTISDVQLTYTGEQKDVHQGKEFVFESNYYNPNTELLPSSTFGTIGEQDANWGNVIPTNTYEGLTNEGDGPNVFPVGCSSKVDVDEENKLQATVTVSSYVDAVLEIWCRYFPDVYTDGTGSQITENSYDYADVIVSLNSVDMRERVNTHWKIVRFPIQLYPAFGSNPSAAHTIKISSNKSLEVCYVSLKKK